MKKRQPKRGAEPVAGKPRGPGRSPKSPKTILLVEADARARARMAGALERAGYRVLQAGEGEEALALSLSRKGGIHLLITDVMMPVMNGKELAERLCAMRPEIRILFVSAFSRDEVLSRNGCSGREWWLDKRSAGARLAATVRGVLEAPLPG